MNQRKIAKAGEEGRETFLSLSQVKRRNKRERVPKGESLLRHTHMEDCIKTQWKKIAGKRKRGRKGVTEDRKEGKREREGRELGGNYFTGGERRREK